MLDIFGNGLVSVVEGDHAEVILEINHQKALGHVLLFGQVRNYLGTNNDVVSLTSLERTDWQNIVHDLILLL